jgi:hypothetical protein
MRLAWITAIWTIAIGVCTSFDWGEITLSGCTLNCPSVGVSGGSWATLTLLLAAASTSVAMISIVVRSPLRVDVIQVAGCLMFVSSVLATWAAVVQPNGHSGAEWSTTPGPAAFLCLILSLGMIVAMSLARQGKSM